MCARDLSPDHQPRHSVPALRVLLFAPATDLLLASAEVAQVANTPGLFVRQRQGEITRAAVVREVLNSRERWDVLWFATHGTREGLLFSDGAITAVSLIPLVRAAGAYLIVLNSCESAAVAEELCSTVGADVIATVISVPDDTAYTTGAYLAHWLAQTGDPRLAYDRSRPGGDSSIYRYFTGRSTWRPETERHKDMPLPDTPPEQSSERGNAQNERLWRLEGDVRVINSQIENTRTSLTVLTIIVSIIAIAVILLFVFGGAP